MSTTQAINKAIWLQKLLRELDGIIHCGCYGLTSARLCWVAIGWHEGVVDCGTQDKGSKWIVFNLESYSIAGLLGVYIHIMSPGCFFLNGLD